MDQKGVNQSASRRLPLFGLLFIDMLNDGHIFFHAHEKASNHFVSYLPDNRILYSMRGTTMQKQNLRTRAVYLALVIVLLTAVSVSNGHFLSPAPVKAQQVETDTPHFSAKTVKTVNGQQLVEYKINGPITPPVGFEAQRQAVPLPQSNAALGVVTLNVPAYNWVFGCSSVSGSMIAGYYDRLGYANMYTGPTAGGVMPMDNSSWGTWSDGLNTYPNIPLAASHNGVDGRATRGSIDDYWVSYGSSANDPYITGVWTQHAWGTAIGDYMKTSQSAYGNTDGSTAFYGYGGLATQLTCADMVTYGVSSKDGTYGRKLFYEARGYTVTDCYAQATDNKAAGGFSFAQYKAEIDAGNPVMLNLAGHTIVGVGYDDATNTVYIHDTWDYVNHTMPWGGSYSGMELLSVSIVHIAPDAFNKTSPANAATGISTSPTFTWAASAGATSYDYCYDTTNDSACSNWTNTTATSAAVSGLTGGTTYYWHVRANNLGGTTYANSNAWWSFTTAVAAPAAFNKSSPGNTATNVSTSPTLAWAASTGAVSYDYCYDTTNDSACSNWTNTTSTSAPISGLSNASTYYWHVRANNAGGTTYSNSNAWWSFTTIVAAPAAFNKSSPTNTATNVSTSPTLAWAASTGATSYDYCYDITNDGACSNWTNTTSTSAPISGLSNATTYYWHVRANNTGGTIYSNGDAWWSFTTIVAAPGAFNKSSPTNTATGQATSPTLSWAASTGATSYDYCYDTTNDGVCSNWTNTTGTSAPIGSLSNSTTYYWHVRANNAGGTTYSNGDAWWSFTTIVAAPGTFGKSSPTNAATGQATSLTLSWAASTGATSYDYCYDTSNDSVCSNWTNTTSLLAPISGLSNDTTYYWQVRANNAGGTTYSNGDAWWSFTTIVAAPAAFNKSSPTNAATGQAISLTLSWAASTGATSYDYCYDTSNDSSCSNWINTTSASAVIGGLSAGTQYFWHVRANNPGGTIYSNGDVWWSFTTIYLPQAFNNTSPVNAGTAQPTSLTLAWGTSTGATSYDYCYDTSNDGACSGWTNTASTSAPISGLSTGTTYYWQVRANNGGGSTYANGGTWWSFTTQVAPPAVFSKVGPSNAAEVSLAPTLHWSASTGAASYEYCYDTTDDDTCDGAWTSTASTNAGLTGLTSGVTYYWQVRATNPATSTYANGGVWWSFMALDQNTYTYLPIAIR
jgi:hypothetical protein